jgi:hypothetical protein
MQGRYQSLPTPIHMKFATITAPLGVALAFILIRPALPAQDQPATIQAAAPAAAGISPDVPQTLGKLKQWRGQYGDEKVHTQIFTTAQEWSKLWQHLGLAQRDALDEKTQVAVCIFIGEKSTAGFKPYIISAVVRDGKMVVSYSIGQPALNEMVAQEITHPWVAAIIPKTDLPIVFKEI